MSAPASAGERLGRTTTGFQFRSVGKNPSASRVAGMNVGGSLEAGAPADVLVLSPSGEVRARMIRGAGI